MMLPNATQFQLALSLGPLTHLCIFIHGELNKYAVQIAASIIIAFLSTVVVIYPSDPYIVASITKATILILTYLLALGGSILTYRAFFHRLRRFPGDTVDSLSKWGAVFKSQRSAQYFLELRDLHKKYGDFVRIGQSQRLCQKPRSAHSMLNQVPQNSQSITLQQFGHYIHQNVQRGLGTI
jgi:hypothetical protein